MNKEFFIKNKKVFLISFVVLFIALIFLLKNNSTISNGSPKQSSLIYNNQTVGELVNSDTDGDGILDWEEGLWGTNPTKIDSNDDGITDAAEIAKMKQASGQTGLNSNGTEKQENLTQTDKFSRELFATITALDQTGGLDQETLNKLNDSITSQIANPAIKKTFTYYDIKTTTDISVTATKKYKDSIDVIFKKSPTLFERGYGAVAYMVGKNFIDVMQAFQSDADADMGVVVKLAPTVTEIRNLTTSLLKMTTPVPDSFSAMHLNMLNGLERLAENLDDMTQAEADPIVAIGAANKFQENMDTLQKNIDKLIASINSKLGN